MGKGFGIAALVIAILAIFIPIVSLYVVYLALILAMIAALSGDKSLSLASFVICLVNVIFLSPLTIVLLLGTSRNSASSLFMFTIVMFLLPIIGLMAGKKKIV